MRLYYKPGACSLAPHIVLRELGEEFAMERVDTETRRTESGDDYLTVNPNGYVPALRLADGEVVTENSALLPYLADRHPEAGLAPPAGTMARVRLQEMLGFLNSELHKAYGPFFSDRALSAEERETAGAKIAARIRRLEDKLADGRDFLLGVNFSVADAYAFVILNWSGFIDFDLSPFPRTARLVERVRVRPAVQTAMRAEGLIK